MKNNKTDNNSKTKKSIIDTYTTIYYVDIVVANKYATLEELKELYTYSDDTELDDFITDADCTTARCIRKSDGKAIILVKFNHLSNVKGIDKKLDFINAIPHEAGHVVLDIYEKIDQNVCNCSPEPFCYLLGYVAECIYKTWSKK